MVKRIDRSKKKKKKQEKSDKFSQGVKIFPWYTENNCLKLVARDEILFDCGNKKNKGSAYQLEMIDLLPSI